MSYQPPYGDGQPPYGGGQPQYGGGQPQYGAPSHPPPGQYPAEGQYPPPNSYQPHGQYPPQNQYQQYPPSQHYPAAAGGYGASPGPPAQPYGAPPQQYPPAQNYPPAQGYGTPPGPPAQPYGAPPQQYPPAQNYPPAQGYGTPPGPPPQQYAAPPQQYPPNAAYAAPPGQFVQPTNPSKGYEHPPLQIGWDATADADGLRKAMKGFGTDEKALIHILANKDPYQVTKIRHVYHQRHNRSLEADVASEVSGHFEDGLLAIIRGPLQQDVHLLHHAMAGLGTKESVLNDVLLGRSNADMAAIKRAYQATYHQSLENVVRGDLSMKTERHFLMVLAGNRAEDSSPVIPQQIDQDVLEIYKATEGKAGTDELLVCSVLSSRNDSQIRSIGLAYEAKFRRSLETVIKKEFMGHMETALLYQLRAGMDRIMRDAVLLEDSMAGIGTQDHLLVNRVVRYHWDRNHMYQVKAAYKQRFGHDVGQRIRGETSGDYQRLLLACIGE